jgi:hypothetical protein
MEDRSHATDKDTHFDTNLDIAAIQKQLGVSELQIRKAIREVGIDRTKIEEYLLNNRATMKSEDEPSFQKRDLNEDETY